MNVIAIYSNEHQRLSVMQLWETEENRDQTTI
jgi:hypothetical protein